MHDPLYEGLLRRAEANIAEARAAIAQDNPAAALLQAQLALGSLEYFSTKLSLALAPSSALGSELPTQKNI